MTTRQPERRNGRQPLQQRHTENRWLVPELFWGLGVFLVLGLLVPVSSDSVWLIGVGLGAALVACGGLLAVYVSGLGLTFERVAIVVALAALGLGGMTVVMVTHRPPPAVEVFAVLSVSAGWGLGYPLGLQRFFEWRAEHSRT